MRLPVGLIDGVLVERENRYRARVRTARGDVAAFVPNPGRTLELLYPGARVLLRPSPQPSPSGRGGEDIPASASRKGRGAIRRTAYDLMLAYTTDGLLVSVDTRLAGPLFVEALGLGRIAALAGYTIDKAEVVYGDSRLDFRLTATDRPPCLVEVKSSTLVEDGVARWPDSPSVRGQRHVRELARAVGEGYRAVVVWIIQRPDATIMTPNRVIDPAFAEALAAAMAQGVEAYAVVCGVGREEIEVLREISVVG